MKKTTAVFLYCILLAGLFSGCTTGGRAAQDSAPSPDGSPVEDVAEDTAEQQPPADMEPEPEEEQPDNDWVMDSPENHGMDGRLLEQLHEALADTEMYAVLTVKDGFLVDEYYQEGYDADSVFRLNSCSKSFTSALVGMAMDQGLVTDLDTSLAEYFPQVAGTDKEQITLRHLLEHTSGIEWYEWNSGSTFGEWRRSDNWVDYVLDQPMAAAPGTTFNYSTGGPHLLAAVLQQVTGMSAYEYGLEHIFTPLGMDSVQWAADDQGITDGGNGISMTVRDAAKFGQLFLDGGSWKGEQLISREWVELSTTQQSAGTGSSGVYGFQWWIQTFGGYDMYYAMGHAGQFIFVVPELELVTVIASSMAQGTYEPRPYFIDYILAACEA